MRILDSIPRAAGACILLGVGLLCGGCVDLIARAIIDPQSLLKDLGREVAANEVRSLFSDRELSDLQQAEQTLSDLRDILADNPDVANADHLREMAGSLEENLEGYQKPGPRSRAQPDRLYNYDRGVVVFNATTEPKRRPGQLWVIELPDNPEERLRSRDHFRPVFPDRSDLIAEKVDPRIFGLNDVEFVRDRTRFEYERGAPLHGKINSGLEVRRAATHELELPERGFIGEPREIKTGIRGGR